MNKIGFDWGTTTTSICFKNEVGTYDYFRPGENTLNTFPTIISYRKKDASRSIGVAAKKVMYSPNYDTYSKLKLKLDIADKVSTDRKYTSQQTVRDFIGTAIGQYVYSSKYNTLPEKVVFTVPDSWGINIFKNSFLMYLEEIMEDIGFDVETQISFCSEPIAAAAYYCKEVCNNQFNGTLFIVDLGGGTIDLTLCQVNNSDSITVLKRCGKTGDNAEGCSGEAFDLEMTRIISEKNELALSSDSKEFSILKSCFEDAKIFNAANVEMSLKEYYSNTVSGKKEVFDVIDKNYNEYPVTVEDIISAFNKVNCMPLKNCVEEILSYCRKKNISTDDSQKFRVILTGGFSNLYCVEATIREMLGAPITGNDPRFDSGIDRESRSTAIAHGAAIIAEEEITVDEFFQKDVGFLYFDVFSDQCQRITLLKSNSLIRELREPVYFERFVATDNLNSDSVLTIFVNDGSKENSITVNLNKLRTNDKNKYYTFGFSIGRNQTIFLHTKDDTGTEKDVIPINLSGDFSL